MGTKDKAMFKFKKGDRVRETIHGHVGEIDQCFTSWEDLKEKEKFLTINPKDDWLKMQIPQFSKENLTENWYAIGNQHIGVIWTCESQIENVSEETDKTESAEDNKISFKFKEGDFVKTIKHGHIGKIVKCALQSNEIWYLVELPSMASTWCSESEIEKLIYVPSDFQILQARVLEWYAKTHDKDFAEFMNIVSQKKENEKETFAEKPPIGIKPKKLHDEHRFRELCEAIARYFEEYNEFLKGKQL